MYSLYDHILFKGRTLEWFFKFFMCIDQECLLPASLITWKRIKHEFFLWLKHLGLLSSQHAVLYCITRRNVNTFYPVGIRRHVKIGRNPENCFCLVLIIYSKLLWFYRQQWRLFMAGCDLKCSNTNQMYYRWKEGKNFLI